MKNFSKINKEFKRITGFALPIRETNFIQDGALRRDELFYFLAFLYFDKPSKIKKLENKIKTWLSESGKSETVYALAGYVAYLQEDFCRAKRYLTRALALNPDNYDNWHDLSFALRHLGKEKISNGINFNYDLLIHYFKRLGLKGDYSTLEKLIKEINEKTGV